MNEIPSPAPMLGLALGGGSVLGYAHVGVLDALEDAGIKPDLISGTSAGAAVAALYAFGLTPTDLKETLGKVNWRTIGDVGFQRRGLFTNDGIVELIEGSLGPVLIEDARIPLAIVATDISTGEKVVLREGPVAPAVQASTCIPGIFAPVTIDGRLLVDGSLVENVPVTPLRDMGAQVVVGVNLMGSPPFNPPRLTFEVLLNAFYIAIETATALNLEGRADVSIEPDLKRFNTWDVGQLPTLLEEGLLAGQSAVRSINEALNRRSKAPIQDGADHAPAPYAETTHPAAR